MADNEIHDQNDNQQQTQWNRVNIQRIRLVPLDADPTDVSNGDIWYNATEGKFKKREAGVTKDLDAV